MIYLSRLMWSVVASLLAVGAAAVATVVSLVASGPASASRRSAPPATRVASTPAAERLAPARINPISPL